MSNKSSKFVVFILLKICIPGLHISLGVFLKFYELFLDECAELDEKIAYKLVEDTSEVGNSRLDELIKSLREAKKHYTAAAAYLTEARSAEEYACYVSNWMGMGAANETQTLPNPIVQQLLQQKAEQEVSDKMNFSLHCKRINK